jgi:hypothetical protein
MISARLDYLTGGLRQKNNRGGLPEIIGPFLLVFELEEERTSFCSKGICTLHAKAQTNK